MRKRETLVVGVVVVVLQVRVWGCGGGCRFGIGVWGLVIARVAPRDALDACYCLSCSACSACALRAFALNARRVVGAIVRLRRRGTLGSWGNCACSACARTAFAWNALRAVGANVLGSWESSKGGNWRRATLCSWESSNSQGGNYWSRRMLCSWESSNS